MKIVIAFLAGVIVTLGILWFLQQSQNKDEAIQAHHEVVVREIDEVKADVKLNGQKLDILLNIATNRVTNFDLR